MTLKLFIPTFQDRSEWHKKCLHLAEDAIVPDRTTCKIFKRPTVELRPVPVDPDKPIRAERSKQPPAMATGTRSRMVTAEPYPEQFRWTEETPIIKPESPKQS